MRSKLFVPGNRPELFAKALASAADAISIDLEDAVPADGKPAAREAAAAFLRSEAARAGSQRLIVRVNALDSAHFEADLRAVLGPALALVNLPKPASAHEVRAAILAMARIETELGLAHQARLLVNIESPVALRRAAELAGAHQRVAGLQLGLGDLFETHGIARREPANVHAAQFALAMAAAEAGVFACDGAFADLQDPAGYLAEARMAQALGFVGKSCIHPSQIALAHQVFRPEPGQLAHAQRVVAAARMAQVQGRAAFVVDGRMIDPPYLKRAQSLLAAAGEPSE